MQKLARRRKEAGGDAAAARKLDLQLAAAKGADLADLALQAGHACRMLWQRIDATLSQAAW